MGFNILVEVACNSGKIVNAEAYGTAHDLPGYMAQRGFAERIEGTVHPTYRHSNGLTAISVVSYCAKFDAAQELTALIRRIGVIATEVKARKRRAKVGV
jgi:hypothetical protein